jgi:UDP-glucuronate 4-epimerase
MNILITGCCGFIGSHLAKNLLKNKKNNIFGIDNINNYYDISIKKKRLNSLNLHNNFKFYKIDISDEKRLNKLFSNISINVIINLAAQAGVRYSLLNPNSYISSNLIGFQNILELAKNKNVKHLISASTSSVYGNNNKFPLQENDNTNNPLSLYAATKKSNEVIGYSYSYCFKLPITFVRFFTVYGPNGRPDMSLYKFVKSAFENKSIELFNKGNHERDFTYIDDVTRLLSILVNKPSKDSIPYNIFNIGSNNPRKLKDFLKIIEKFTQKKIKKRLLGLQLGDTKKTHASNKKIHKYLGVSDKFIGIEAGIENFVNWYKKNN